MNKRMGELVGFIAWPVDLDEEMKRVLTVNDQPEKEKK